MSLVCLVLIVLTVVMGSFCSFNEQILIETNFNTILVDLDIEDDVDQ
jgi:hypothetical protein